MAGGGRKNGDSFPWRKDRAAVITCAAGSAARARLREGDGGGAGRVLKVAFGTLTKPGIKVLIWHLIVSKPRAVPILGKSAVVSPVPCASRVSQPVRAGTELPVLSLVIPYLLRCKM